MIKIQAFICWVIVVGRVVSVLSEFLFRSVEDIEGWVTFENVLLFIFSLQHCIAVHVFVNNCLRLVRIENHQELIQILG